MHRITRMLRSAEGPLGQVARTARRLAEATAHVNAVLPAELRGQVWVARLTPTRMLLGTGTSSLATRLRFAVPEIVEQLRRLAMFRTLEEVQVRVIAMPVTEPAPMRVDITLPPTAANHLQALADELAADSARDTTANGTDHAARAALAAALESLAQRAAASPDARLDGDATDPD